MTPPPHGMGTEDISAQGGPWNHRREFAEDSGYNLVVTPFGGRDAGGRSGDSGGLYLESEKYDHTVQCNAENDLPLLGGVVEAGDVGI